MSDVSGVAVLGAGTMGRGIAEVAAVAGLPTALYDVSEEALRGALAAIEASLQRAVQAGRMPEPAARESLARLRPVADLAEAVAAADAVIEAVPEILDLKLDVFRRVSAAARPEALIASNTSTISISRMAVAVRGPERFVGMHFFNPVPRMALVEVVVGRETTEAAVERAVSLTRRLGKEPVVVQDSPGFATSRLGVVLGNEAMRMLEQGVASAADIDKAMRLGYNHPMGPLELADLVGLDARLNNCRSLHEALGEEHYRPPAILERLVAEGKLGRKAGRGFYQYDASGRKVEDGAS